MLLETLTLSQAGNRYVVPPGIQQLMLFNSVSFAVFLAIVFSLFRLMRSRPRQWLLLIASYLFYGAWDWRFLSLIWISTLTDFLVSNKIFVVHQRRRRKQLLLASIGVNLGILAVFKYWGFFLDSASDVLSQLGLVPNVPLLSVVLPVGISFYTFQTLGYTIDVYRRDIEPERDLLVFALFVAFFPQLVAGPIERASRLLPQLRALPDRLATRDIFEGLQLIGLGLFRKVAIADGIAPYVDSVFSRPAEMERLALVAGALAFAIQIYGDFAGYTDIARGTARLFGVQLMENFKQPYRARSVSEFWRRWHISLSEWLRDYLYIPLGGNRNGAVATYRNLMLTMLLGGLWHGADWTFVAWGAIHGSYLIAERTIPALSRSQRSSLWALPTFVAVCCAWIPFRSDSIEVAVDYVVGMIANPGATSMTLQEVGVLTLVGMLTLAVDSWRADAIVDPTERLPAIVRGMTYGAATIGAIVLSASAAPNFIYFQF